MMSENKKTNKDSQTKETGSLGEQTEKNNTGSEVKPRGSMTDNKSNGDGANPLDVAAGTKTDSSSPAEKKQSTAKSNEDKKPAIRNNLRQFRIEQMMSKAELARKAGLSVLTIDRIEKGFGCRMDTKRKILKALGLKLSDRRQVFKDD